MVARVTYDAALDAFCRLGRQRDASSLRTYHHEVAEMLASLGIETDRRRFRSWKELDRNAIVAVNRMPSGAWHWVVFDAGRPYQAVLDPRPGQLRIVRDFKELVGSGDYIEVAAPHDS